MPESTTVTVGLDVHASSIRLAAVRADELLDERTLPYDHEAVERSLRHWPVVRCCYEAGPRSTFSTSTAGSSTTSRPRPEAAGLSSR
jgi:hypothetical protein